MENIISTHAKERIRERLHIPFSKVERQYKLALERGYEVDKLKYDLYHWAVGVAKTHDTENVKKSIIYNRHVFLIGDNNVLVTVLQLPKKFHNIKKYLI